MLVEWEKSNRNEKTSVKGSAEQIRMANKMIMIYSDNYQSNSKSKKITRNQIIYQYGCAIENMSLQAINLGLGSCILCDTLYIENKINEYLGIKRF